MASIFTKIINGEIPCHKIAESDDFFAFLDIGPLAKGHTLVVPKKEEDYLFKLDDELLGSMMIFSKKVAMALEKTITCQRVGVLVVGTEVPHAHIHLIPFQKESQMSLRSPKIDMKQNEMAELAAAVRENFEG